jgi:endonuclease YncB( thermonuclease family)
MSVILKPRVRSAVGLVEHVTDGDTFVTQYLDLGWGSRIYPIDKGEPGYCAIRVCLPDNGWYDAPEKKDRLRYKAATTQAKEILVPGLEVYLVSYGFSMGRTVASVTLPDGSDFATLMIAAGHTK